MTLAGNAVSSESTMSTTESSSSTQETAQPEKKKSPPKKKPEAAKKTVPAPSVTPFDSSAESSSAKETEKPEEEKKEPPKKKPKKPAKKAEPAPATPAPPLSKEREALLDKHALLLVACQQRSERILQDATLPEEKFEMPAPTNEALESATEFPDVVVNNMALLIEGR